MLQNNLSTVQVFAVQTQQHQQQNLQQPSFEQVSIPSISSIIVPGSPQILIPSELLKYPHRIMSGLGATQIIIGLLCIIFMIALNVVCVNANGQQICIISFVGYGYWGGLFFLITGILGIVSTKYKGKCLVKTFLSMSVLSSLISCFIFGLSITDALITPYIFNYNSYSSSTPTIPTDVRTAIKALPGLITFLSFIELIISILSSSFCCRAIGCCCSKTVTKIIYVMNQPLTSESAKLPKTFDSNAQEQQPQQFTPSPNIDQPHYQSLIIGNHYQYQPSNQPPQLPRFSTSDTIVENVSVGDYESINDDGYDSTIYHHNSNRVSMS